MHGNAVVRVFSNPVRVAIVSTDSATSITVCTSLNDSSYPQFVVTQLSQFSDVLSMSPAPDVVVIIEKTQIVRNAEVSEALRQYFAMQRSVTPYPVLLLVLDHLDVDCVRDLMLRGIADVFVMPYAHSHQLIVSIIKILTRTEKQKFVDGRLATARHVIREVRDQLIALGQDIFP